MKNLDALVILIWILPTFHYASFNYIFYILLVLLACSSIPFLGEIAPLVILQFSSRNWTNHVPTLFYNMNLLGRCKNWSERRIISVGGGDMQNKALFGFFFNHSSLFTQFSSLITHHSKYSNSLHQVCLAPSLNLSSLKIFNYLWAPYL